MDVHVHSDWTAIWNQFYSFAGNNSNIVPQLLYKCHFVLAKPFDICVVSNAPHTPVIDGDDVEVGLMEMFVEVGLMEMF